MNSPIETENSKFIPDIEFSLTYRRILGYLRPFMRFFVFAIFGFGLFALSQPAFAVLMEAFVNALDGKIVDGLYLIPLACVAIALVRGVGSYLGSYYMAKVSENVIHNIRCDLFQNILALPIPYFDKNKSGRLISLFTYNTGLMTATTTKAVTTVIREGLTVIALLSYLVYQSPKLTLIFLILAPPLALVISWVGKKIKRLGHGIQATVGELNHVTAEVFSGIRLVKSVVAEESSNSRFRDVSEKTRKLGLRMAKINSIYTPIMQMLIVFAMAVVMYVVLLSRDVMGSAALIAYVTAASLLPKPIRSLSSVHPQLLQGVVAAGEVFRHIDYQKEIDSGTIGEGKLRGDLDFENVCFAYAEDGKEVLRNINFTIKPGQTVAMVGRSGGGKSTLANLIPKFYSATSGHIRIDGRPIQEYKLDFLRRNVAIVSQNVNLFNSSVADNIAFGLSQAGDKAIEDAAKAANAHDFIIALPEGYDTVVGENGVLLSGGQRQRLAIARAILRNSPILILDEATSALDNESEVKVQEAIDRVIKQRTTLVIAHRLSTIEHADKILVLENGEIVESGNHEELMNKGNVYAKMVQRDFSE
ncbi:MAG: lipid A export permease/ATP-binding protein MsbA [Pseudomonadales bacterium]